MYGDPCKIYKGSRIGHSALDGCRILCGGDRGWASVSILEVGMETHDCVSVLGTFGQRNFGHLELGDKRRTARLVEAVDLMCRHPGGTLPQKLNRPADLRGFYRLMRRP